MELRIDTARCGAYANCTFVAPELFEIDYDQEVAVVLDQDLSGDRLEHAREAVRVCPTGAILLAE